MTIFVRDKDVADVGIFVFDCLYLNGTSILDKPLRERRELMLLGWMLIIWCWLHGHFCVRLLEGRQRSIRTQVQCAEKFRPN